jgi:hypothetical protein
MKRQCNINGYVDSTGYNLTFDLYNYKDILPRRASHTPTSDGGVDQDWGISEFDRTISGYALLLEDEWDIIRTIYEHETAYLWKFSNGSNLWNVTFKKCLLDDKEGDKFKVQLEFNCSAKVQ